MATSIDTIGASSGVFSTPQAASAASGASSGFSSALSATSASTTSAAANLYHSPHVIQDPSAGFITQYLSANGSQVVSQTPSVITVAYLRLGLSADGSPKQSGYQSVGTVA